MLPQYQMLEMPSSFVGLCRRCIRRAFVASCRGFDGGLSLSSTHWEGPRPCYISKVVIWIGHTAHRNKGTPKLPILLYFVVKGLILFQDPKTNSVILCTSFISKSLEMEIIGILIPICWNDHPKVATVLISRLPNLTDFEWSPKRDG